MNAALALTFLIEAHQKQKKTCWLGGGTFKAGRGQVMSLLHQETSQTAQTNLKVNFLSHQLAASQWYPLGTCTQSKWQAANFDVKTPLLHCVPASHSENQFHWKHMPQITQGYKMRISNSHQECFRICSTGKVHNFLETAVGLFLWLRELLALGMWDKKVISWPGIGWRPPGRGFWRQAYWTAIFLLTYAESYSLTDMQTSWESRSFSLQKFSTHSEKSFIFCWVWKFCDSDMETDYGSESWIPAYLSIPARASIFQGLRESGSDRVNRTNTPFKEKHNDTNLRINNTAKPATENRNQMDWQWR